MGYNANAELVYGIALSEEEEKQLEDHEELYDYDINDIGLVCSGDGRVGMYAPVLGFLLGKAYDWAPEEIDLSLATSDQSKILKKTIQDLGLKYRRPKYYLVASVS